MFAIFGALFLALMTTICQATDPCTSYSVINDVYRSSKYRLPSGHVAICDDKLTENWYRFTSIVGGMMPETKVAPYHCGTVAPVWISDTHPTKKGKEKEVAACTNINNLMNGCLIKSKITIKHCGEFYLYKLKPVYGCPRAYCAGDKMPCPKGEVGISPNCTVSNIAHFPSGLVPVPTVTYRDNPVDPLTMLCKFQFPSWKNVSFGIEWFTDGFSVKNHTICNDKTDPNCIKRDAELPALHPDNTRVYFRPGHRVHCKLRMKYNTYTNNKWAVLAKQSNQFFVGIKVVASHLNGLLQECNQNTKITVTFTPTVPIVVANKQPLSIKIIIPSIHRNLQSTSAVDKCELKLEHGMPPNKSHQIMITPICDNLDQADGSMEYHFVVDVDYHQPFWLFYRLPSVRVTVQNTPQIRCSSITDPHYNTFDGRYYDFMPIGDYVLYRNKHTDTEVHARSWVCVHWSNSVTCNCGAAIREGADIIIFSVCNGNLVQEPRMLSTEIRSEAGLAPGVHIIRTVEGSKVTHDVILPSGNRVKVERYDWGLNIFVKAFAVKPNTISGLCGDGNGNVNDEFQLGGDNQRYTDAVSFGNSWRLDPRKSNFNLRLPAPTLPPGVGTQTFCDCPPKKGQMWKCEWNANQFQAFQKRSGKDIADQFRKQQLIGKKRSISEKPYNDDIQNYEDTSFFVDEKEALFALSRVRTRRSVIKEAMSTENATKHCRAIIKDSTAGKTCIEVPGFNITSAMKECVTDLKLTGNIKFAGAAFDSMKEACEEVALKNVSLYKADTSGKLQPPTEIGNNLCPGDCSNHGNCTNRTCICKEGFTSDDCSMSINAVPELLGIYNGGLCDIRKRPCKKIDIFGNDFIDSENITCHIREFKVVYSNWIPKAEVIKKHGEMIDIFGVRCQLPDPPTKLANYDYDGTPAGGLWIRISNDGERESQQQKRFISFDSVCMSCNKTGNCSLKANSCLIRGHCFAANESNPRDWCQQCMPGENERLWTRRKVNHPPSFEQGQSLQYAIVGEHLLLQLKARDPDNRPVRYSLLNTTATQEYGMSSTGLLQWNVTKGNSEQFTVEVKDECNATDYLILTVRINVCQCKNGGQCSPHPDHPRGSGIYSCRCPTGFTGDKCQTNIDDCESVDCGNGTCIDGINNHTCRCQVGFMGLLCDQKVLKCTNHSCFTGVQCTETSTGISCAPCPLGLSGDGKICIDIVSTTERPTEEKTTVKDIASTTERPTEEKTTEKDLMSTTERPTEEKTTEGTTLKTEESLAGESTTIETEVSTEPNQLETRVTAEISLIMEWQPEYEDKESIAYRSLVAGIEDEIQKSYRRSNTEAILKDVKVISLRPGSIVVRFQLKFKTATEDPLIPLKKSIEDGTLGTFDVNSDSLKIINTKPETTKDRKLWIIIIPVAIAVLLVLIAILVFMYRNKRSIIFKVSSRKRSSVCVTSHCDEQSKESFEMKKNWMEETKIDEEKISDHQDTASTSKINYAFQR